MRTRLHQWRVWIGLTALFVVIAGASGSPLRIATGDSLPKGLYWLGARHVSRGSIALVCLPMPIAALGRARGYLHAGACVGGARPVGKPVVAVAGDFISLGQGEIRVNGVRVDVHSPPDSDSLGRPLSRVSDGTYKVVDGEVWLISSHHLRSWDSRFFGPVSDQDIIGELRPIWVFSSDPSSELMP